MTALDAAQRLLEEAGEPLHYQEITRRILESGMWTSTGRTPDATVNALLAKRLHIPVPIFGVA